MGLSIVFIKNEWSLSMFMYFHLFIISDFIYIASGDSQKVGNLLLCHWVISVHSVSQDNHGFIPFVFHFIYKLPYKLPSRLFVYVINNGVVGAYNVCNRQRISLTVRFNGVIHRNILRRLFHGTEVHQDFICYPHIAALNLHL